MLGIVLALLGATGSHALGRQTQYRLDQDRGWVAAPGAPATTGEGSTSADRQTIADARRLLAEDNPRAARQLLDRWLDTHERGTGPYVAEAYLLRADALIAVGHEYSALYDLEAVCKRFPQTEAFPLAVERELDVALDYLGGKRRRFLGMRMLTADDLAVELLIRVQERLPGSELAERAAIELADYYYRERQISLARDAYELYTQNFPHGPNRMKAEERWIFCDLAQFKGPQYEIGSLTDAKARIRAFRARYRTQAEESGLTDGLVARIDESMAAQLLSQAEWYIKRGDAASARYVLRRLLRERPGTLAADQALAIMENRGWMEPAGPPADLGSGVRVPDAIEVRGPQQAEPIDVPEALSPDAPPAPPPDMPLDTPPDTEWPDGERP